MIIDGFTFFNELELLEIRLEELYPVVDKFVLVQADMTFRGEPKPFYFQDDDPRWAPYINKILSIDLEMEDLPGPWEREAYQRNILGEVMREVSYYSPDDVFIISDLDEVPRRSTIEAFSDLGAVDYLHRHPQRLQMRAYYYGLNVRVGDEGTARILLADDLTTAQEIRKSDPRVTVPDAGWHFSYLGDAEFISNKIKSFSHAELDTPEINNVELIARAMSDAKDLYGRGNFVIEEIDDTWPEAVKSNPERWKRYIW